MEIRTCGSVEDAINHFHKWAVLEQWNPGRNGDDIAHVYFPSSEDGFFLGVVDGKTVSVVSVTQHNDTAGYVSFYIVHPEHRKKGYGYPIFKHAVQHLENKNQNMTIGLDAVCDMVDNYKKAGFIHELFKTERRQGLASDAIVPELLETNVVVKELSEVPLDQLVAFDARGTGIERLKFFQHWIKYHQKNDADQHDRYGVAVVSPDDGTVVGFGCVRPGTVSWRIGPIYANNSTEARVILDRLSRHVEQRDPGAQCSLDICLSNPEADALAPPQWQYIARFVRLWKGSPPTPDASIIYAVTSVEVG